MKQTSSEKWFDTCNTIMLILVCIVMLYPVLFVFGRSVMTDLDRAAHPFAIWPTVLDMSGYKYVFSSGSYIANAYMITILRTLAGTFCSMLFTAALAFALSNRDYPLRNAFTLLIAFTMWFGGGLIPLFLLVKSLGLYNHFAVLILPGLISAWNMLILRNFFMQIPTGIIESARMDGANDLVIFLRIILPLSSAALATISLFYAVGHWNSWFDAMIYIHDRDLWPMQVFLREIIHNANLNDMIRSDAVVEISPPAQSVIMATIVVTTVPILCVYPFLQRYFVKGITVGSIKG
ncbi:carbohydrate ABC transporter permease [Paenibacillus glycanilyticus]|uniref:carbohydrate ABC transporter permease n=1 Tax=Paenibacillus glycanilyticus TaxID=126569 RepID=UPI002041351F|nr:carbohydrate ABC transporter permease [Paenibacillus glycanilyticus]MCM3626273.1 carbohydrate ABC transporter permease [Paenibacillus glycanilyticus]